MKLKSRFCLAAASMAALLFLLIHVAWTEPPRAAAAPGAPILILLNPDSVNAGAAGFTLTVQGAFFTPRTIVRWNGENCTTAFINEAVVRALIPASDVAAYGSADVTVVNPALLNEHSGASNALVFRIMPPAGSN